MHPKNLFGEQWVKAEEARRQPEERQDEREKGYSRYQQLLRLDGVVGVNAQFLCSQRDGLLEFGGQEHADSTQELQVGLGSRNPSQEAVQVIHGQREDLLLTLLFLTDLQCGKELGGWEGEKIVSGKEKKVKKHNL